MMIGKTPEEDLAFKLTAFREHPFWNAESESLYIDNLCNSMYRQMTEVDGYDGDLVTHRITQFLSDVRNIMHSLKPN